MYFDARSFPDYGALSGNRLDDLRPGQPVRAAASMTDKRFHADWALWKAAPAGRELTWQAPWGTGFPGWHTECSAMSLQYLGDVIDIHTGGIDLRFPHHEDERAQSNSVTGHEVVRHWVHGEHVLFEGRKMAKSTGNVVLLADVTGRGLDPLAVRLAFLEHRYRQQMNLTWETLTAADGTLRRWREQVAEWANEPSKPMCAEYWSAITGALDEDLDTPAALRALRELAGTRRSRPGRSSRRSPAPTACSAWTWRAGRPAAASGAAAGRSRGRCWRSGPRPAGARTSRPRTGCGLSWPTSA